MPQHLRTFLPPLIALILPAGLSAEQPTLEAPAAVDAAAPFAVEFSGGDPQGAIHFTDLDARPMTYNYGWHRASQGSPANFQAPTAPGEYAIYFISSADNQTVLAETKIAVNEVEATLSVPPSISAGEPLAVRFSGPIYQGDFISMTRPGAPVGDYSLGLEYARRGRDSGQVEFDAPIVAGDYEVRYVLYGKPSHRDLASASFTVTEVSATVTPPQEAIDTGATFSVEWTGPDTRHDVIALTELGAAEASYAHGFAYTARGNPAELSAPTAPGEYVVRYVMQGSSGTRHRALAEARIHVGKVEASLDAPVEVRAGSELMVAFEKPETSRGYIAIGDTESEGPDSKYGYQWAVEEPVKLTAPDRPGDYTIRYIQSGSPEKVLVERPLKVTPVSATLDAAATVVARSELEVRWQGPGNPHDLIGIYRDQDTRAYGYTRRGNPLVLEAPSEPGEYVVRYMMNREVLAERKITVTPAPSFGSLRVVSTRSGSLSADSGVLVILDASGSMWQKVDGKSRIEVAREALLELVAETIPAGTPFAFRAFGHKEPRSCRTDLEIPLGPLDPAAAAGRIRGIQPQDRSKTPIAASLNKVLEDLGGVRGERIVVLVTDGEETCDGDPEAAIRKLTAAGVGVRVNIVGFAIDEFALRKTFERWSELGGGAYFDAHGADQLSTAIQQAVDAPFEVLSESGRVVASGAANGQALELPTGDYRVRWRGTRDQGQSAKVTADRETVVDLERGLAAP